MQPRRHWRFPPWPSYKFSHRWLGEEAALAAGVLERAMPAEQALRQIALMDMFSAWIDSQVAEGGYASASHLIRTALRVWRSGDEGIATFRPASFLSPSRSQRQA